MTRFFRAALARLRLKFNFAFFVSLPCILALIVSFEYPALLAARNELLEDQKSKSLPQVKLASLSSEQFARLAKVTVAITVHYSDKSLAEGFGFFTGAKGLIVTNAHFVDQDSEIPRISRRDGKTFIARGKAVPVQVEVFLNKGTNLEKKYIASLVGRDERGDLALLKITATDLPEPVHMATTATLEISQEVYVVGLPPKNDPGKEIQFCKAKVSTLPTSSVASRAELISELPAGDSGGPVVDKQGAVVGVSLSGPPDGDKHFLIPSMTVHEFVKRLDPNRSIDLVGQSRPIEMNDGEVKLSGTITDTCTGGGGRYWMLHSPSTKEVAIFDATVRKVVKTISTASKNMMLAAGMNKLILIYPDAGEIVRYDLGTLQLEKSSPLPLEAKIRCIAMGSASHGPLLLVTDETEQRPIYYVLLDVHSLKTLKYEVRSHEHEQLPRIKKLTVPMDIVKIRVSPNGRLFTITSKNTSSSISSISSVLLQGDDLLVYSAQKRDLMAEWGHALPLNNNVVVNSAGQSFTPELKLLGARGIFAHPIPAQQGDFRLALESDFGLPAQVDDIHSGVESRTAILTVRTASAEKPILRRRIDGILMGDGGEESGLTPDKRVLFSPAYGLIAVLGGEGNKIILVGFNNKAALETNGTDYPLITSLPPRANPGEKFNYQINLECPKGSGSITLELGPPDMTLQGHKLTWDVPRSWIGSTSVVLKVCDAGKNVSYHAFELDSGKPETEERPIGKGQKLSAEKSEKTVKLELTKAQNGMTVHLPARADSICVGGAGRFLCLQLSSIHMVAVLDLCEGEIVKFIPYPNFKRTLIAASLTHLYIVEAETRIVTMWNFVYLEKELTQKISIDGRITSALSASGVDGPLMIGAEERGMDSRVWFFDGTTLKETQVTKPAGSLTLPNRPLERVLVSPNGKTFAKWTSGSRSNSVKMSSDECLYGIPGPEGSLFTNEGILNSDRKPISKWSNDVLAFIPAIQGSLYLEVADRPQKLNQPNQDKLVPKGHFNVMRSLFLCTLGEVKPIGTLGTLSPSVDLTTLQNRIFLCQDAKIWAMLGESGDRITFHLFDLETIAENSSAEKIVILNRPDSIEKGKVFRYTPKVKAVARNVKIKLEQAPEGMKLDHDSLVWEVPSDFNGDPTVIIFVSDDLGAEIIYTFKVMFRPKS